MCYIHKLVGVDLVYTLLHDILSNVTCYCYVIDKILVYSSYNDDMWFCS